MSYRTSSTPLFTPGAIPPPIWFQATGKGKGKRAGIKSSSIPGRRWRRAHALLGNMAELEIGQHCGVEECKQLDFLPFVCDGCSGVFCIQHRSLSAHGCSEANLKNKHMKLDYHKSFPCMYKDCDGRELVPVLCAYCEKQFCLRHRHQSDHECEKLEIPEARMTVTRQLIKNIVDSKKEATSMKKGRGAKNPETAAKVALMKLKMHACGEKSVPQTDRIYFQVFLPKGSKNKSIPMYFCSKWSIGKAVDCAARLASLKNDNNKTTAKKLRLCHTASGEALPLDHTVESWINSKESPLYNGGNVILEYLDNDVEFLADADSYL